MPIEKGKQVGFKDDLGDRVLEIFRQFDRNGDGVVSREELHGTLNKITSNEWSDAAFSGLVSAIDTNNDGVIQYEEFLAWVMGSDDSWEELRHTLRGDFHTSAWVHVSQDKLADHYDVGEVLGTGGFGSVQIGTAKCSGQLRAIKSVPVPVKEAKREAMMAEMALMKELDHPNIAQLYEVFENDDKLLLVLELCSGGELLDFIVEEDEVHEYQVAAVMRQILSAVRYMHAQGVCHRDLKPENFLLKNKGVPIEENVLKIIDFGASCKFKEGEVLTRFIGTPEYMSPDQVTGEYDHLCDLWACGVVMFFFISGELPFEEEDEVELYEAIEANELSFEGEVWQDVSRHAKDLIRKLMTSDSKQRICAEQALQHRWMKNHSSGQTDARALSPHQLRNMRVFCTQNKLKKAALHHIARVVANNQVKALQEVFASLDVGRDGYLTYDELKAGLATLPKDVLPAKLDISKLMAGMDVSWNGKINYTEFLAAALDKNVYEEESLCRAAFRAFDFDGDGVLSREDLAQVLCGSKDDHRWNSRTVNRVLLDCDENGDRGIDFQAFLRLMRGSPDAAVERVLTTPAGPRGPPLLKMKAEKTMP